MSLTHAPKNLPNFGVGGKSWVDSWWSAVIDKKEVPARSRRHASRLAREGGGVIVYYHDGGMSWDKYLPDDD